MWFGGGSDVVWMWFGGGVFGSGADNLAQVKGKWFPATTCKLRDLPLSCGYQGRKILHHKEVKQKDELVQFGVDLAGFCSHMWLVGSDKQPHKFSTAP